MCTFGTIKIPTAYRRRQLRSVMKALDTNEAFLPTLKNTKRKMPRIIAHLREQVLQANHTARVAK